MKAILLAGYGSDANQTRIRAAFVTVTAAAYLHTGDAIWLFLLAFDYFILLNVTQWLSPSAVVSRSATRMIGFAERDADAAEKRFADQIKFTLTLGILGADLAGYVNVAGALAGLFAIWSTAEAIDDSCLGCALYRWFKRHDIEIVPL